LIQSKEINEKFTDFEFSINKLKDLLEDRLNVHQIRIDAIFENEINFIPLIKYNISNISIEKENPNDYSQIVTQKRIRNLLGMKLSFTQDVINSRKNLDTEIKDLLFLIETALNSKQ
jgi:predicted ATPase